MATPKKATRRRATPEQTAKRAEATTRTLRARLEAASIRNALKAQRAMLATYAVADRGRKNKDWRASGISADQAIIPDAEITNARSRQMARDNGMAKSAISAFCRNVIGCGIIPIPQATREDGQLDAALNRKILLDLWTWASDKHACDVEQDQTFWQQQTLLESERVTVGEGFWVWSYEPNLLSSGRVDRTKPVGFKLQAFEPEQLDTQKQSHTDVFTGINNEVRGGLELNGFGVVVAYHVYARNPNDYLYRQALESKRIPAERVIHYYKKERVRQKRGVTPLAPVLQDIRDSARAKEANLWRIIMEACIGVMVKRDTAAGGSAGTAPGMYPRQLGDTGKTPSGMPTVDWVPGMVADAGPGNSLEAFIPQAPGNQYEPFQVHIARGVAAGAGISYGQLTRDFTRGTYSGQRQEMLEDRKEFEPLQELCAHNAVLVAYRLWLGFYFLEGRGDARAYALNPARFNAAEYVAPPPTWIDPKAEAESIEKLIALGLMDREEAAAMRGRRLSDILDKLAAERKEAEDKGIVFPETVKTAVDPETEKIKGEADAYGIGVRAGVITPNADDEAAFRKRMGLPPMPQAVKDAWEEQGGYKTPITLTPPEDAGGAPQPQFGQPKPLPQLPAPGQASAKLAAAAESADTAPNYREAPEGPAKCGACRFFLNGQCSAYAFPADAAHVCDAFEAMPPLDDPTLTGGKGQPPGPAEGDPPMDDPRSPLLDRGERGVEGSGD